MRLPFVKVAKNVEKIKGINCSFVAVLLCFSFLLLINQFILSFMLISPALNHYSPE